jgi:hypothetical protein
MADNLINKPYRYDEAKRLLRSIIEDFEILSGDSAGEGATWQDVAGSCAVNLEVLSLRIKAARAGRVADGFPVFPSPSDLKEPEGKDNGCIR